MDLHTESTTCISGTRTHGDPEINVDMSTELNTRHMIVFMQTACVDRSSPRFRLHLPMLGIVGRWLVLSSSGARAASLVMTYDTSARLSASFGCLNVFSG